MRKIVKLLEQLSAAKEALKQCTFEWQAATVKKEQCRILVKQLQKDIEEAFDAVVDEA